ncbi:MAG TPA: methyltransferase domain-containing protein [Lysobacter sp.]
MHRLQTLLTELEADPLLEDQDRLPFRLEVLDRIDACLPGVDDAALLARAQATCARLDGINATQYAATRAGIRAGNRAEHLPHWVRAPQTPTEQGNHYDFRDDWLSGVLGFGEPQAPTIELSADMVFYQPTPVRHIVAMIAASGLGEGDVLIDLGSGLGHVPLLAAILTRARTIGVELEPAYVACAQQVASSLNLVNASFVQGDVRDTDFSAGTVFYLYTPFKGALLRDVLDRLRAEAKRRPLRLCTFGPCTATLAGEPWLVAESLPETDRIAVFRTC